MSGFLVENRSPGATTGIVIGPVATPDLAPLAAYRHLQWWTDRASWRGAPSRFTRQRDVETVQLDCLPAAEFGPAIERFFGRDARHLPSLYVTTGVPAQNNPAYSAAIDAIHAAFESHQVARVTRQKDGFTWQRHLLLNTPAYIQRRLPATWQGALRGRPGFVCGAGPSLDVTAPRLAAVADRGVVFAADSALRALARHGVSVDFAVSVDAAKQPAKCIATEALPRRVVLATVSPPAWNNALPVDHCFFLSGRQVTEDWLANQGVARTAVAVRENCGSTALELAHFLGCAPIYLFGLDLAVDAASPAHRHNAAVDSTLYTNSGYNSARQLPTVPGNYAARVPTFAAGDWRALDERLAGWPAGLVFNVNDRGARYRNTTLVHPQEFVLADPATDAKFDALDALDGPGAPAPAARTALARMRDAGLRATRQIDLLYSAIDQAGPPAVVRLFRDLMSDQDTARVLGAFSFKLMPHLLPPVDGDATFWRTLIEEFAALTATAAQLSSSAQLR